MYKITFDKNARASLKKLPDLDQKRIIKKLRNLISNPRLGKPLVGRLVGLWSLRIGKYRALYQIFEGRLIVLILDIGHRKNVYNR